MRAAVAILLLAAGTAAADPLRDAQSALLSADYRTAADLAEPISLDGSVGPAVRAEAQRILGLALFALDQRAAAENVLLRFLESDPDARLDPALYPPEMVVFFEDVRARHAGDLLIVKPRPKRKQYAVLNLIPPFGQIQNRQPTKAWVIGVAEVALLAANVTTYALLRSSCDDKTLVCDSASSARALRGVNLATGGLLVATYFYGVIDGFVGYHPDAPAEPATRLGIVPAPSGAFGFVSRSF